LHGGFADCGNALSDWFGLFNVSWSGDGSSDTRLSDWLDPCGTAPTTLDGKNPAQVCWKIEDFETGDFNYLDWILSGDANWTITSDDQNSGLYSAKAGAITDSQSTSLEVTLSCVSGNIKFHRKVSSEGWDILTYYIDGNNIDQWSGLLDWTQVVYPITEGTHTFRWTYSKDYSSYEGADTAWLDDIQFPIPCLGLLGDFDGNARVDFLDMAILAAQWQGPPATPSADIAPEPPDGIVDILDLGVFTQHWLEEVVQ
jgi:hypothetical protein